MNNFQLPRRLQNVQTTLIRQLFERALPGSINFGLGEPDLPTPRIVREEAARVVLDEQNGYTSHSGLLSLRENILTDYANLPLTPNEIIVTCGSQEAMTTAVLCVAQEGDDVLLPDPVFAAYPQVVHLSGANPIYYKMPADKDFGFDIEEFQKAITPNTKAVVVVSPSNPTGKILTANDAMQIAEVLKGTGIWIISDEIYRDLYFTAERPVSIADYYERTLIVSGLSKSMSMTGWRLGWLASQNKDVMKAALVLHGYLTVCASSVSQKAALVAWTTEAKHETEKARQIYHERRNFFVSLIRDELKIRAVVPDGAFYTMVDVREYGECLPVAEKLLQHKVITVPGIAFGEESRGFLRLSICNDEAHLAEGVKRIKQGLNS